MRGWQPSIAITSVVPERSAPIMMTGRSLRLSGIFRGLQIADPGEEVEEHLGGRRLEGVEADLLQDHLAAVAGIERDDRGAQFQHLLLRDLGRRDERHVRQLPASGDDTAAVLLPAPADA